MKFLKQNFFNVRGEKSQKKAPTPKCWEASPIYRGVSCLENKLGLLKN